MRISFSGVCGSDLSRIMVTGAHNHPLIPGHELCGIVEDSSAPHVKRGEKVAVLPLIPCGTCTMCKLSKPFHCQNYDFIGSRRD
ncbi:MAG: alcohol dehydrogenase catalytic domain-containing protein [Candidatus Aenigmarchaeota archaeon]|nr:alcohol dehydrogenase catalytic domain-containing protein [Candidatus Aenigmarchaeota archaeon]